MRKEIHQIESLNEDLQKYLLSVEKLELELPSEGFEQPEKLTDEDIDVVVRNLLRVPEALACNYIEAHEAEGVEDPRVEEFRRKIHDMYDEVVLCKEVKPDPPRTTSSRVREHTAQGKCGSAVPTSFHTTRGTG